jgi:hypothetical protein
MSSDNDRDAPTLKSAMERLLEPYRLIDRLIPRSLTDELARSFTMQNPLRGAVAPWTDLLREAGRDRGAFIDEIARMSRQWKDSFAMSAIRSPLEGLAGSLADHIATQQKTFAELTRGTSSLAEELAKITAPALAWQQTIAFARLAELAKPFARDPLAMQRELASAALPSAAVLGYAPVPSTAVLTGLEADPVVGALSWLEPSAEEPTIRTAAVQPAGRESNRQQMSINVAVRCSLCRQALCVPSHTEFVGDRVVDLTLDVLPVCPPCRKRLGDTYLLDVLESLERPTLEIISGDGENPTAPDRSHLRLVSRDPDDGSR